MKLYEAVQDDELMKDLQVYFDNILREHAIEKTFAKESTLAVAEAKEIVDKAFENISVQFAPKVETKEPINEAR